MPSAFVSLRFIYDFQIWSLLRRTCFLNEQETKYVFIYLNDNLKTQVRIGTSSGNAMLNDTQWFILVTFKSQTQDLSRRTCWLASYTVKVLWTVYPHQGRELQVHLSKNDCSQLIDSASRCIDRQVINFCKLQNELVEWCNSVLNLNPFVHL
jgi:hypothetical protein